MKIYQTANTLFDHISKYLEVRQKYSAVRRRVFHVRKCDLLYVIYYILEEDLSLWNGRYSY